MCFLVWYLSLSINLQERTSRNTSNDSSRKHWNSAGNKQPCCYEGLGRQSSCYCSPAPPGPARRSAPGGEEMEQMLQARAEHQRRGRRRGWEGRVGHHDLGAKTWEACQPARLKRCLLYTALHSSAISKRRSNPFTSKCSAGHL